MCRETGAIKRAAWSSGRRSVKKFSATARKIIIHRRNGTFPPLHPPLPSNFSRDSVSPS